VKRAGATHGTILLVGWTVPLVVAAACTDDAERDSSGALSCLAREGTGPGEPSAPRQTPWVLAAFDGEGRRPPAGAATVNVTPEDHRD
jgi:hypothetical protein